MVEGQVPAREVRRLLAERPEAVGLTVPDMPLGSPGMEADKTEPYDILLVHWNGSPQIYARYPSPGLSMSAFGTKRTCKPR